MNTQSQAGAPLSQLRPADIAQAMRVGLEAPMLLTAAFLSLAVFALHRLHHHGK